MDTSGGFLDNRRLKDGPWRAFERDTARLLIANGFDDVRIVGGSGDHGGDVLAIMNGELWVFQVKLTTSGPPPRDAIAEVVEAARYYGARRMVVVVSRNPGDSFLEERLRYQRSGLEVEVLGPPGLLSTMQATPEYSKHLRALRDYQVEASSRFRDALRDTGRGQIVLATGLGKTIVMAETTASLLRDGLVAHDRVLVLAHTRDLVEQLHQSFWPQLPKWVPTHQLSEGEVPIHWDGITFATVQSVASLLDRMPPFGLVLVDEAHHIGAATFRRVIDTLAPEMLGGVTATPWRGDAFEIDELLGPAVFRMGIAEGLTRGFLAEVDYRLLADNIDWDVVQRISEFRYSLAQLNKRLILPTRDEQAVRIIREAWDGERRHAGVVFCASIEHAQAFAAMLRRYNLRAEPIASDTPPRERYALMARFRAGELDVLTTVDLFNEGVDVPDVDLIVFMRATHSR
jgi:superfamily II DNA or RNA helicase/Holliday junction resolvase